MPRLRWQGGYTRIHDPVPVGVSGNWRLDFRDEFDGATINESKWQIADPSKAWNGVSADPARGGLSAPSTYGNSVDFGGVVPPTNPGASSSDTDWSAGQLSVASGVLTVNQTLVSSVHYGGLILSRWPLHYGYYESRLRYTSGWPAWWIAWHGDSVPETDDDFLGVEIDIAEGIGWTDNGNQVSSNLHTGGYGANHVEIGSVAYSTDGAWHVVGMWWTSTFIRWYLDGTLVREVTSAPYIGKDPGYHYMLLNNAKPNSGGNGVAEFDYVRHWIGG